MTRHTLRFLLAAASNHFLLISWVFVDIVLAIVHQTAPDLEEELHTLLAQDVVIYSKSFRLIHDQLFLHVCFNQLNEFVVQNVFVLSVLLVFLVFAHEQVQQADDVVLFQLEAELILALAKKELDEGVLVDDQILALLVWVEHLTKEGHHVLGQSSDLVVLRKSLYNLH